MERVLYRSLLKTARQIERQARNLPAASVQHEKLAQARLSWLAQLPITGAASSWSWVVRAWFESAGHRDLDVGFAALREMQQALRRTQHACVWKQLLGPEQTSSPLSGLVLIAVRSTG